MHTAFLARATGPHTNNPAFPPNLRYLGIIIHIMEQTGSGGQGWQVHTDLDSAVEEVFNIYMLKKHISQITAAWVPFVWTEYKDISDEDKETIRKVLLQL